MVDGQKKRPHGRRTKKGRPRKPSSHVRPSKRYGRKRCGAIAKSTGKPCRRWAMANGRCMIHGGKSPKGEKHPSFKTGLHSNYYTHKLEDFLKANPTVAKDLEQADLQGVDDEIRVFTAMLMMHMEKKPKQAKGKKWHQSFDSSDEAEAFVMALMLYWVAALKHRRRSADEITKYQLEVLIKHLNRA